MTPSLVLLLCAPSLVHAQDGQPASWPQFRGPGGLALAGERPIPTDFGPGRGELWRTPVAAGHSSPCIWGDRVFLTGFDEGQNVVFALDRKSGKPLWEKRFEGASHPQYMHADAVPALPTPCTDGQRLIAYLGDYGLVALDLEGRPLWERRLPHPGYGFGIGTSPVLLEGILILMRDGAPEQAILALDAATGEDLWRIDRLDYGESHGTPFVWHNADRTELVIAGTRRLCSFDPASGELLWMVDGVTVFPCTTPTADEDTLYFAAWSTPNASGRSLLDAGFGRSLEVTDEEVADPSALFERLDLDDDGQVTVAEVPESRAKDAFGFLDADDDGAWTREEFLGAMKASQAPGKNVLVAVARGGEGDVSESHVRWKWERGLPYVASPLLYRGRLWLFKAGGLVTCLDAASGKPVFDRERLGDRAEYYLSPVAAAGHVLAGSAEGTLYLLDAEADELAVEHEVRFEDELFATPAVIDGTLYVRTRSTMWAFGAVED